MKSQIRYLFGALALLIVGGLLFLRPASESAPARSPLTSSSGLELPVQVVTKTRDATPLDAFKYPIWGEGLETASSLEGFLNELSALLKEDERAAIDLLTDLDHPLMNTHSVAIGEQLASHLFEHHSALEAIMMLDGLSARSDNIFHCAARELLSPLREQKDSPAALAAFLNENRYPRLIDEMDYTIGKHLARGSAGGALEALELLGALQRTTHTDRALQGIYHQWAIVDTVAAAQHIASQPADPLLDVPLAECVTRWDGNNSYSSDVMPWAERIIDPAIRNQTIAEVAETWYVDQEDREAYATWKAQQTDPDLLKRIARTEMRVDTFNAVMDRARPVSDLIAAAHNTVEPTDRLRVADLAAQEALALMQRASAFGDPIDLAAAQQAYTDINTDLRGEFRNLLSVQQVNAEYLEWQY
ncbi:hypothetical protein [Pontiella agarivorans]|uniref:Secreted protein n=1 Tax=Pontiella agarivorans TaxID=3038953 RepID=A0ABU5MY36_9BACT|nr:hypothetical protein [Pontiella agarivorans]MDZ8119124.1 hypothetical protein [Pontiella agarivorans]